MRRHAPAIMCAIWVLYAAAAAAQGAVQPAASASAATAVERHGRSVEIRWDMALASQPTALEIWVDCKRSPTDMDECDAPGQKFMALAAYAFELKDSDTVALVVRGNVSSDGNERLDAQYALTGVNVDDAARQQLAKLFPAAPAAASAATKAGSGGTSGLKESTAITIVSDKLLAGGRLTATFRRIQTTAGKDTVVATSSPVAFKVAARAPWFAFSVGVGLTRAPAPSVAIVKTGTVVTFTKDGKTQQAYQSAIHIKDADASLKPIDTAVVFLNFRLAGPAYISLGFPANQTVFTQPMLGGSIRIPAGSLGLVFTAGAHFTRETQIVSASGFTDGQIFDPTLGLTVGDIPTETAPHQRFFFAFSINY